MWNVRLEKSLIILLSYLEPHQAFDNIPLLKNRSSREWQKKWDKITVEKIRKYIDTIQEIIEKS